MVVLTDFPPPVEGIHHTEENTTAYMKNQNLGKGSLFIAESRLSWTSSSGGGFSLEYQSIKIHAISRDISSFPHECLYLQVEKCEEDNDAEDKSDKDDSDESNDEDDFEKYVSEIRFVPDNKDMLDVMFNAMSDCQALNPDPGEASDEDYIGEVDEDEVGIVFASALNVEGSGDAGEDNEHIENGNGEEPMDVGQFEDVENDP